MIETVQSVVNEFKRGLQGLYRERLRGLYLYGSYARGEQEPDSDLDLLVILDQIEAYGSEIDRTSELVSSLSLRYSVSLSRVFVTEEAWHNGQSSFPSNLRTQAVAA